MSILRKLLFPNKKKPTLEEQLSHVPTKSDIEIIMSKITSNKEKEKYWDSLSPRKQEQALRIASERERRKRGAKR